MIDEETTAFCNRRMTVGERNEYLRLRAHRRIPALARMFQLPINTIDYLITQRNRMLQGELT